MQTLGLLSQLFHVPLLLCYLSRPYEETEVCFITFKRSHLWVVIGRFWSIFIFFRLQSSLVIVVILWLTVVKKAVISEMCGFSLVEEWKKQKTFFSNMAGCLSASMWGVSGRPALQGSVLVVPSVVCPTHPPVKFLLGSAWHGSQQCVRIWTSEFSNY